jgi:hypothetical protein
MRGWKRARYSSVVCLFLSLVLVGCASIPPEAPEMSAELGKRIAAIQDSNLTLLHRFFDLKRDEVDRFIQNEWVPLFAKEIFSDPRMKTAWDTIVSENNAADRLKFLLTTGPRLQERINQKRVELIRPLDDIEKRIEEALRKEYIQAGAINNSITSFLVSASKIQQNRNRYLEMIGLTDKQIGNAIDKVNDAVGNLLSGARKVEENVPKAEDYLKKLREIKDSLSSNKKEG